MKTLGQRIRELREAKDLSLRELARQIDKTPPFLSDIELGRRNPSDDVLGKIAALLGASLEELKKLDTRPPIDGIKKKTASDPTFALAFRMVVDSKVTPQQLIELAKKHPGDEKKK